jgi:hypothetical protein
MTNLLEFTIDVRKSHRQPQNTFHLLYEHRLWQSGIGM